MQKKSNWSWVWRRCELNGKCSKARAAGDKELGRVSRKPMKTFSSIHGGTLASKVELKNKRAAPLMRPQSMFIPDIPYMDILILPKSVSLNVPRLHCSSLNHCREHFHHLWLSIPLAAYILISTSILALLDPRGFCLVSFFPADHCKSFCLGFSSPA